MFFLLMLLYSISTTSLTAALLPYTTPFFLLGARMTLAGIALLAYTMLWTRNTIKWDRKNLFGYAQATLFAILLPYALRYYGLKHTSVPALSQLMYSTGPLVTCLLAHLFCIEKITTSRIVALSLSSLGFLLYLGHPISFYLTMTPGIPELALLLSIVSFSYGWIVIRDLIVEKQQSLTFVNGITMGISGMISFGIAYTLETPPTITNASFFIPTLMVIVIVSNIIAHTLYAHLLKTYSLTLLQLGYWFIPITSTLCNAISMHQLPHDTQIFALALVTYGFILLYQTDTAHSPAHNPLSRYKISSLQ